MCLCRHRVHLACDKRPELPSFREFTQGSIYFCPPCTRERSESEAQGLYVGA